MKLEEKPKGRMLNVMQFACESKVGMTSIYSMIKKNRIDYYEQVVGLRKTKLIPESELKKFPNK